MSRLCLVPLAFLIACGSKAPIVDHPPEDDVVDTVPDAGAPMPLVFEMRAVDAETPVVAPWGATLTVPSGWLVGTNADVVRIEDPERDLTLASMIQPEADRDAAFAAAWQRIEPGFDLAVAQVFDLPPEEGWDAIAQAAYVTPVEDNRIVIAFGRQHDGVWHVALVDGASAGVDRRGAQLNSIILDMKVPGMEEESWAAKTALLGDDQLATLDAFVEQARAAAGVPGAAIAIVHGGQIVLEHGYGVRGVGKKAKAVKPGTAFMIGSTTKSLTTLMMARLVDDQKIAWDAKVHDVLPWFALGNDEFTNALTLQHTVCACTGLPRQDMEFLFEYGGWTPERRLEAMATMVPTTGFGETFQYSNSLVAAGGYTAAHAYAPKKKLGAAYDAAMQALVFDALGMKATTLDFAKAQKGDWAKPTAQDLDQEFVEFPVAYESAVSALRPAGGVWSTAHDMAQYLLLELANGKTAKGKQLVTEASLLHRRDHQVKIAEGFWYGLGLFVSDEHGIQVIHHGGNMLGYTSDLVFLPGADIGYVLLTNAGGANTFRDAIRRRFLEVVYEAKPQAEEVLASELEVEQTATAEQKALLVAPDDAWLKDVLGSWTSASLGTITLSKDKHDKLIFDTGEWQSEFTKMVDRDGSVQIVTVRPPYAGFTFRRVDDQLVLDAGQQTYEFARK